MGEERAYRVLTERSPACHDWIGPRDLSSPVVDSWTSFHPQELRRVMSHPVSPVVTDDLPVDLPAVLDELTDRDPSLAQAFVRALSDAESPVLRAAANHMVHALARDACLDADVDAVVSRALRAQEPLENWTDGRIDAMLRDIATTFAEQAEDLAAATGKETGL